MLEGYAKELTLVKPSRIGDGKSDATHRAPCVSLWVKRLCEPAAYPADFTPMESFAGTTDMQSEARRGAKQSLYAVKYNETGSRRSRNCFGG
jgi:hypothetical protein